MKKIAFLPLLFFCGICLAQAEKQKSLVEYTLAVTPNPSEGSFYVDIPAGSQCSVSSTKGTYIGTWIIENDGFRMSGLPTGSYVLRIQRNGEQVTRKVLVI